jgi:hypothetical protein
VNRKPSTRTNGLHNASDGPGTPVDPEDLRRVDCSVILDHAQRGLGVELVTGSMVSKRRTVNGPTARGTWLRIECRSRQRVAVQGWGGVAAAAALTGVAKPEWYQSISWRDAVHEVCWRADETQLVTEPTVAAAGPLVADPGLDQRW